MAAKSDYDLLIRAGRVFCATNGLDGPGAVAVRDGRIVKAGANVDGSAKQILEYPGGTLLPGLIDLHVHVGTGSVFGVDPDRDILARGVTTVLSQGDAGADNIRDFVRETIERSRVRVKLAINLSRVGESTSDGCFSNLEYADVDACVSAANEFREFIWGIAINISHHACEQSDPREVFRRGLDAAERANLPLLFGMRRPEDWSLEEQLELLRPGDVVTYCYRREPHCFVQHGHVLPEVIRARERGVYFDIGHGTASFDIAVAQDAIGGGFLPDTISTDIQRRHIGQAPPHDLPLVMSKLQTAGMSETQTFISATQTPARIIGLSGEIGSLSTGSIADLTILNRVNADHQAESHWTTALTVRESVVAEQVHPKTRFRG